MAWLQAKHPRISELVRPGHSLHRHLWVVGGQQDAALWTRCQVPGAPRFTVDVKSTQATRDGMVRVHHLKVKRLPKGQFAGIELHRIDSTNLMGNAYQL